MFRVVAALFMFSMTRAAACTMALVSTLPLQPDRLGLLADVTFNTLPARLIFDTGSQTSVLNLDAAYRLNMRVLRGEEAGNHASGVIGGIGGGRAAMPFTAHSVDIGGLRGHDYNFLAAPGLVGLPADGLLSVDLMSQFDIDLDLPEHKAMLYRPVGDCTAPAAFLDSPLYMVKLRPFGTDRRPRVLVDVGGRTLVAMIDTGAARSAIFRRAAERVGLRLEEMTGDAPVRASGVGPHAVRGVRHVFERVGVGELTLSGMAMDVLDQANMGDDVDMILGVDFQRQVHVWISYSSHSLIMQYPARASKKV